MSHGTQMTPPPGTLDTLTRLADRQAFLTSLRRDCLRTASSGGMMALLIVNVDQFRRINSIFGIKSGDQVLIRLAKMLQGLGRRQDRVARIGSDEFGLILSGIMNEGHAVLAANKILRELETPIKLENEQVPVSVTVGIALSPDHSSHPETLLKHAELALLKARRSGNHYLVAEPVDALEIADTWDLEIELDHAVENSELELYYQPQVDIRSHKPVRAEALMRWNSPSRGLLMPTVFIPVAEQSGRIRALTEWALNTALRQTNECRERTGRTIEVSVNMPATAFQSSRLLSLVGETTRLWGSKGHQLTLEITESIAMADPDSAFAILKQLRSAGARIAIDDFGTGYSSLSYFRDIPADELKIDRSFLKELAQSEDNQALVHVMIELGHHFHMQVVAEGVETVQTMARLKEMGCDLAQGKVIASPMPFDDYCEWLKRAADDWRAG